MENTTTENTTVTETTAPVPVPEKATRVAKAKVEVQDNTLTFNFADGQGTFSVNVLTLPDAIRNRGLVHGIEQKLRDSYAGAKSASEAYGLAQKVLDQIMAGEWNAKADGSGADDSIDKLVRAVTNAYLAMGKDVETASAKGESVRAYDKAKRAQVRSIPAVAVELAKLKTSTMSLDDI